MKKVSKELKEFILSHNPKTPFHKTVHHDFVELNAEVIRLIALYEEQKFVREDDKSVR